MWRPRRCLLMGLLLTFCLGASAVFQMSPAAAAELQVFPDLVEIGAFFQGVRLEVKGDIPAGAEAILEIKGRKGQEELVRKGRRGGMWMSVGEIRVYEAPSLYLLLSSAPKIPALKDATPWGFEALEQGMKIQGDLQAGEQPKFSREFLELKKSEGLYAALPGMLKIGGANDGRASVRGAVELPAKVPPGAYEVRLSAVRDGRLVEQHQVELQVKMVGFPALLVTMAYGHGALYGIVAVLIAIITGFVMGFLFKGKAEH